MTVTLHNTDKLVYLNIGGGQVPARIWEGETSSGIPCHAYITRIAVANDRDATEFEQELLQRRPATPAIAAIPSHLVL